MLVFKSKHAKNSKQDPETLVFCMVLLSFVVFGTKYAPNFLVYAASNWTQRLIFLLFS